MPESRPKLPSLVPTGLCPTLFSSKVIDGKKRRMANVPGHLGAVAVVRRRIHPSNAVFFAVCGHRQASQACGTAELMSATGDQPGRTDSRKWTDVESG